VRAADLVAFAGRALTGHRLRGGLSLAGVAIGVASVVILTGLGEGARLYVVGEFAQLGTNLVIVLPGKTETTGMAPIMGGVPNDLTLDDLEAIRREVPQVRRAGPVALGQAKAAFRERSREVMVIGTSAEMLEIRKLRMQVGRFLPEAEPGRGPRVCAIGADIQRELFQDRNPLGEILEVGGERFRVIGVVRPRGVSVGVDLDEVVHVPAGRALRLFNQTSLFRILIEVRSHQEIEAAKRAVVELLTDRHGEEDVTVITQDSVLSTFSAILKVLTAAIGGIAAISLGVAGVAIMNVMLVSVSERTPEIGLLKALGAGRRQIVAAFLVEAALLSTFGGLIGLAVGLGANAALQVAYPAFPVTTPRWAIVAALAVSAGVGLVFGALPAVRAARLDPIVALGRR
jgi:putative ABC transport system permease protein